MTTEFRVDNKLVTICGLSAEKKPVVFFNNVFNSGEELYEKCLELQSPDFTLVTISNLNWDKDMAPWPTPESYPPAAYCNGQADHYLSIFLNRIIPKTWEQLKVEPAYKALAGYSLGGLFALYTAYKAPDFERLACASGSFWYPDFLEFVKTHTLMSHPSRIYFSLGDEESHSSITQFDPVEKNTEFLAEFYRKKGIETTFVLNPGNHYFEPILRMAHGIKWMLEN